LGVHRLLAEGGARLHGALLRAGAADQVLAFVAPCVLGRGEAPCAVVDAGFPDLDAAPRLVAARWESVGDDLLVQGYVPHPA
ncbi:MAG: RibD family protein, partial [Planctomycetota bacterium]